MAYKLISVKCPDCGQTLSIEENRTQAFCTYCGAKVLISNENEYVFRQVDEAGIQKAETERLIKLKELELQEQREARAERKVRRQEIVEESLRRRTKAKLEALHTIAGALETCRDHLADIPDLTGEMLEERRADLTEAIERVRDREAAIRARTARTYQKSLRILRANPSAIAREFGEAMDTLRKLGDRK